MGGVFSSPIPPAPAPSPAAAPAPAPAEDPAEKEREARLKAISQRRRGRDGAIATSPTGTLAPASPEQSGKTKLGQ